MLRYTYKHAFILLHPTFIYYKVVKLLLEKRKDDFYTNPLYQR